jgi:hypothetical protein
MYTADHPNSYDAYEVANGLGVSPQRAAHLIERARWRFVGYSNDGEEKFFATSIITVTAGCDDNGEARYISFPPSSRM